MNRASRSAAAMSMCQVFWRPSWSVMSVRSRPCAQARSASASERSLRSPPSVPCCRSNASRAVAASRSRFSRWSTGADLGVDAADPLVDAVHLRLLLSGEEGVGAVVELAGFALGFDGVVVDAFGLVDEAHALGAQRLGVLEDVHVGTFRDLARGGAVGCGVTRWWLAGGGPGGLRRAAPASLVLLQVEQVAAALGGLGHGGGERDGCAVVGRGASRDSR
jgi:hypothetical protein